MKGIKFKALHLGRTAALLGASTAVVGLSLIGGGVAHAALGSGPGQLTLSPATGPLTTDLTWSTTTACPAGFSFGTLQMEYADSTASNPDYNTVGTQTLAATAPITGGTIGSGLSVAGLESAGGWASGQTAEFVVLCSSGQGGTGTTTYDQSLFLTFGTSTYTTSANGPAGPATTTTVVSASPNPAQVGTTVTLTATVSTSASGVATPAGTVQFESGGTAIGAAVTLNASGVATTTTTFTTAATDSLTAVYTPSDTSTWAPSTSAAFSETITSSNPLSVGEVITVTVPPSGSFSFSGTANATAALTVSGSTATGTLVPVSVSDSRTGLAPNPSVPSLVNGFNGFPGWSVVGQATDFTNPTSTPAGDIPVANFNWTPTTTSTATGNFALGSASTTGLGSALNLVSAPTGEGQGTFTFGANLTLTIPASSPAGAYSSTLTLTANPTANFH
jgi:large repetitive protein